MPRVCTPGAAYGCGHHDEHVLAALKGWETRRRKGASPSERKRAERAEALLSRAMGERVSQLHTHASHPNEVRYKVGSQWYQMSRAEFADFEKWARQAARERDVSEREAAREAARADADARVIEKQREIADLQEQLIADAVLDEWQGAQYREVRAHLRKHPLIASNSRLVEITDKRGRRRKVYRGKNQEELEMSVPREFWRSSPRAGEHFGAHADQFFEVLMDMGHLTEAQANAWTENDTYAYFEKMTDFEKGHSRGARAQNKRALQQLQRELRDLQRAAREAGSRKRRKAA